MTVINLRPDYVSEEYVRRLQFNQSPEDRIPLPSCSMVGRNTPQQLQCHCQDLKHNLPHTITIGKEIEAQMYGIGCQQIVPTRPSGIGDLQEMGGSRLSGLKKKSSSSQSSSSSLGNVFYQNFSHHHHHHQGRIQRDFVLGGHHFFVK